MDIKSAQYVKDEDGKNSCIKLVLNSMPNNVDYTLVPLNTEGRHYQAIQEWVAEGNTIEDAD
jgi:hypothetical protein